MTPIDLGIIIFVVLMIMLSLGVPIGISMALCGFVGFWSLISFRAALSKLTFVPFEIVADYNLAVLPLFILMAEICMVTGISDSLFKTAAKWVGRLPGGLAIAGVGACTAFGAVSSSAIATAATIGLVAAPEMQKYKYDPRLITGSLAAGGTLGIMIPPSSVFIIYGVLTETSIGKLFIGGIFPGLLVAAFYITTILIVCKIKPRWAPPVPDSTFREKVASLKSCGDILVLIILVLGGLMIGWFTPTEAGAIGASGAIILTLIRRRLTWKGFLNAWVGTLKTSGMIYTILIGAFILNYFVAATRIPQVMATWITGLNISPLSVIGVIMLIYIILGIIMDEGAMTVLTIPIFFPIISSMGLSPIWFGVLVVRMVEIAMITPPLGVTMYVMSGITKQPLDIVYKGVWPFIVSDVISTTILILFPIISTWLPSHVL